MLEYASDNSKFSGSLIIFNCSRNYKWILNFSLRWLDFLDWAFCEHSFHWLFHEGIEEIKIQFCWIVPVVDFLTTLIKIHGKYSHIFNPYSTKSWLSVVYFVVFCLRRNWQFRFFRFIVVIMLIPFKLVESVVSLAQNKLKEKQIFFSWTYFVIYPSCWQR